MSNNPRSWDDIFACPCSSCLAIAQIRRACIDLDEPLFVCDCRMYGRGWQVGDIRKLFIEPASLNIDYPQKEQAVGHVLDEQHHCDVYVSSWPLRPEGHADFLWSVETFLDTVNSRACDAEPAL